MAGAFFAGAFFAGAFFAGAFFAGAFFAAAFLAGAFFAGAFFAGAFFAAAFFAGAFLAGLLRGAFLAGAFFAAAAFLAVVFLVVVFLAGAAAAATRVVTGAAATTASFGSFLAPDTTFFRSWPALNFGTCGLLRLDARTGLRVANHARLPHPLLEGAEAVMATFSPLATSRVMVSRTDSSAWRAAFLLPSNREASASIS